MTDQLAPPDPQLFDPRDYQDPLSNGIAALAFQASVGCVLARTIHKTTRCKNGA